MVFVPHGSLDNEDEMMAVKVSGPYLPSLHAY